MKRTIFCDKCNKQSKPYTLPSYSDGLPDSWYVISFQIDHTDHRKYILCSSCSVDLGVNKKKGESDREYREDIADRLLDIIRDIVSEEIQNTQGE